MCEDGGALLVSSGPEFAGDESLYRTPLASVLPAQPTGEIIAQGFKPLVTADRPRPSGDAGLARQQYRIRSQAELGPLVPADRRQSDRRARP